MKITVYKKFLVVYNRLKQMGLYVFFKKVSWRFSKTIKKFFYLAITQNKKITIINNHKINRISFVNLKFFDCRSIAANPSILEEANEILNNYYYVHDFGKVYCKFDNFPWENWEKDMVRSFHRHDFFITLARALKHTDKEKYKIAIEKLIKSLPQIYTIDKVRDFDKSIDIAIRILNWTAICYLIKKDDWTILELKYWFLQIEWMIANLSPGGNHRLLEGLGLVVAALYFTELNSASRWLKIGKNIVINEMNHQVSTEGIHLEQSMYYHQICTTHFLKFYLILKKSDIKLSISFMERLKKMFEYIWFSQKPDGSHPIIGDGDQLVTNDREHWEARALLPIYEYLYKVPVNFPEKNLESADWFIDTNSYKLLRGKKFTDERQSIAFKHSGHTILKNDSDNYLYFNCGPIGYAPYPHHGHPDALSVEICMNNKTIVMDSGGYGYYNDQNRKYFRSTFSHNTAIVDRKNQSEIFGVFGYGKLAKVWLTNYQFSSDFDFVEGCHDGYSPIIHKRQIFYVKKPVHYILIADFLIGNGEHIIEIPFHFSPECDVQNKEEYISLYKNDFKLHNFSSSHTSFEIIDKNEEKNNYKGFVSLQHSKLSPSQIVIYKAHTFLPYYSLSIFSPIDSIIGFSFFQEDNKLLINNQQYTEEYIVKLINANLVREGYYGNTSI